MVKDKVATVEVVLELVFQIGLKIVSFAFSREAQKVLEHPPSKL